MGSILPAGVHSLSNSDSLWTHYFVALDLDSFFISTEMSSHYFFYWYYAISRNNYTWRVYCNLFPTTPTLSTGTKTMISSLSLEPFRILRFTSCCFPPQVLRQLYPSISPIKVNYKLPEAGGTSIFRRGNRQRYRWCSIMAIIIVMTSWSGSSSSSSWGDKWDSFHVQTTIYVPISSSGGCC